MSLRRCVLRAIGFLAAPPRSRALRQLGRGLLEVRRWHLAAGAWAAAAARARVGAFVRCAGGGPGKACPADAVTVGCSRLPLLPALPGPEGPCTRPAVLQRGWWRLRRCRRLSSMCVTSRTKRCSKSGGCLPRWLTAGAGEQARAGGAGTPPAQEILEERLLGGGGGGPSACDSHRQAQRPSEPGGAPSWICM